MNIDQLQRIAPRAVPYLDIINESIERFGIAPAAGEAAFLAQMLHESANFTRMTENLNYSPASLMSTFNTSKHIRFTADMAAMYGRTAAHPARQEMIANIAYANRLGNGSIESGDGWRYRGRGPGQLTGRSNYEACGRMLGLDLVGCPDQVAQPDVGCLAFGWFWSIGNKTGRSLNRLAVEGRIDEISITVNGGTLGLPERSQLTARALEVLA